MVKHQTCLNLFHPVFQALHGFDCVISWNKSEKTFSPIVLAAIRDEDARDAIIFPHGFIYSASVPLKYPIHSVMIACKNFDNGVLGSLEMTIAWDNAFDMSLKHFKQANSSSVSGLPAISALILQYRFSL